MESKDLPQENRFEDEAWMGLIKLGGFSFLAGGFVLVVATLLNLFLSTTTAPTKVPVPVVLLPVGFVNLNTITLIPSLLPNSTIEADALWVSANATSLEVFFLLYAFVYAFLIPAIIALYMTLRTNGRGTATVALGLGVSGVLLGFAFIPSAFSPIRLEQLYTSTSDNTIRSGLLGAALASEFTFFVGNALSSYLLDGAVVFASYLMIRDRRLGKRLGYLGIVSAIVSGTVSFLPYPLSITGVFFSVFVLAWIFLTGVRLVNLSKHTNLIRSV